MNKEIVLSIVESTLGHKDKMEEIVFKNEEDLRIAYREIQLGKDIMVTLDGKLTIIPHRVLSTKVYDGTLRMSAKIGGEE